MKKNKFALISLILLLTSCISNIIEKPEINSKLSQLYLKQESIYKTQIDTSLFSKDLLNKLNNVKTVTKQDEERIKKSEFPTDKPIQLEGSIFSSLYEGYSKYTIQKISVEGNHAEAIIDFENSLYKESWSDKIILVKESSWKIDNVIFSKDNFKDLKEKLNAIK